jgi:hypothetical protein
VSDLAIAASSGRSKVRKVFVVSAMKRAVLHELTLPRSMMSEELELCSVPDGNEGFLSAAMGGTQHGTHVIGIVSMEDARLLHYITLQNMAKLIREKDAVDGPR